MSNVCISEIPMPRYIESKLCYKGNEVPGRFHVHAYGKDICTLFLMLAGELMIQSGNGDLCQLEENHWYFQCGGSLQIVRHQGDYRFFCITFRADSETMHNSIPLPSGKFRKSQKDWIDSLCHVNQKHGFSEKLICNSLLYRILANVCDSCTGPECASSVAEQVAAFLASNFQRSVSVQELADKYHYSAEYLSGVFKKRYGVSIRKYEERLRISHAKGLIWQGNLTMAEIATACGYKEYSTFYRAFLAHTQLSPQAFSLLLR